MLNRNKSVFRRYRGIFDTIVERIRDGSYQPGQRLPGERDLATEFGVSRPTVREALIALEILEHVTVRVGSGVYVTDTPLPPGNIVDPGPGTFEILESRLIIEADVSAIAAHSIGAQALDTMHQCIETMKASLVEPPFSNEADMQFHLTIAEATGNSVLHGVVQLLWTYRMSSNMWDILEKHADQKFMQTTAVEDHTRILEAMEARDADAARDAMRLHMQHNIELMQRAEFDAPAVSESDRISKKRLLRNKPQ